MRPDDLRTRSQQVRRRLPPWAGRAVWSAAVVLLVALLFFGQGPVRAVAVAAGVVVAVGFWRFMQQRFADRPAVWRAVAGTLLVAGVAAVLAYLRWRVDGLGIGGAVVAYLGAGALVTEFRRDRRLRPWRGAVLLVVGFALLVAALDAMPNGMPQWTLWALAIALVICVPVGANLLSEDTLGWLGGPSHGAIAEQAVRQADPRPTDGYPRPADGPPRTRLAWVFAIAGLAVAIVSVVLLVVADVPVGLTSVLAIVVLVLTWAVVVDNEADVVLVLVVLGLVWSITPAGREPGEQHRPAPEARNLVAFGDSYMSGEGAQVFFAGTDDKGTNECRRSPTAFAAEAVENGATPYSNVAFVACSGARARHIHEVAQQPGEPPAGAVPEHASGGLHQIAHLQAFRVPLDSDDVVIVSIGGNDAGFSTIGLTCLAPGDCNDVGHLWTGDLDHVRTQVRGAYAEIRSAVGPDVPVVVVPYPTPLNPRGCDATWLTDTEHAFINDFANRLNATVRSEAEAAGFWYLADMQNSLADRGLRLCDGRGEATEQGRGAGINFIGLRSVQGALEQRLHPANWAHNSLHPNERGHDAMGEVFAAWLAEHPDLTAVPDTGAAQPDPDAAAIAANDTAQPPCGLTDTSAEGCRARARNWALRKTVGALWPGGLVLLALTGGAWLLWIGLVAAWRASDGGGTTTESVPDEITRSQAPA